MCCGVSQLSFASNVQEGMNKTDRDRKTSGIWNAVESFKL